MTIQKLGKNHHCGIAEHSVTEVRSQLCLVVPSLCLVDCMKQEGNVIN